MNISRVAESDHIVGDCPGNDRASADQRVSSNLQPAQYGRPASDSASSSEDCCAKLGWMRPLHSVIVNRRHACTYLHVIFDEGAAGDVGERGNSNARPNRYIMLDTDEVRKDAVVADLNTSAQDTMMANEHAASDPNACAQNSALTNDDPLADLYRAEMPTIVLGRDDPNRGRD